MVALAAFAAIAVPGASPGATGPNGETLTLTPDCSTYPPYHSVVYALSGFPPRTDVVGKLEVPGGGVYGPQSVQTDDNGRFSITLGADRPGTFIASAQWSTGSLTESLDVDCGGPLGLNTSELFFTDQRVGYFSAPQQVTVTNWGPDVLTVRSARLAGRRADYFLIASDSCSDEALAVEESCFIRVRFGPQHPAYHHAFLELASSATASPYRMPLYGNGLPVYPPVRGPAIQGSVQPARARAGVKDCFDFEALGPAGRPLRGARIHFAGLRDVTDDDGTATLCAFFRYPGTRTARITKRGYRSLLLLIPVRPLSRN